MSFKSLMAPLTIGLGFDAKHCKSNAGMIGLRYRPIASETRLSDFALVYVQGYWVPEWFLLVLSPHGLPPGLRQRPISQLANPVNPLLFLMFFFLTFSKVSNVVNPRRGEIKDNSGQGRCYPSDWCPYHPRWSGLPEVLHLPHYRSWISCCRSLDGHFWEKCYIPPQRLSTGRRFSTTYSEASTFLCGSHSLSQSWVSLLPFYQNNYIVQRVFSAFLQAAWRTWPSNI